jgi:uncharacterized RDD family membrane protein YckC
VGGVAPLEPVDGAGPLEPVDGAGPLEPVAPATVVLAAPEAQAAAPVRYVGLATRAIAFTLDAAVIDFAALLVGIGASLILSLLHITGDLKTILTVVGAAAYILWSVGYFVVFWSTTGQTPGARIMQIRVQTADGAPLKPRRALVRCAGVILGAIPLFAGYVRILFDPRRRGFQDRLAGTVVVEAPKTSYIAARRAATERARRERIAAKRPASPD